MDFFSQNITFALNLPPPPISKNLQTRSQFHPRCPLDAPSMPPRCPLDAPSSVICNLYASMLRSTALPIELSSQQGLEASFIRIKCTKYSLISQGLEWDNALTKGMICV